MNTFEEPRVAPPLISSAEVASKVLSHSGVARTAPASAAVVHHDLGASGVARPHRRQRRLPPALRPAVDVCPLDELEMNISGARVRKIPDGLFCVLLCCFVCFVCVLLFLVAYRGAFSCVRVFRIFGRVWGLLLAVCLCLFWGVRLGLLLGVFWCVRVSKCALVYVFVCLCFCAFWGELLGVLLCFSLSVFLVCLGVLLCVLGALAVVCLGVCLGVFCVRLCVFVRFLCHPWRTDSRRRWCSTT